jgi:hypothetical protein
VLAEVEGDLGVDDALREDGHVEDVLEQHVVLE